MLGPNAWAQGYENFSLILNEDYYASIHIALAGKGGETGWRGKIGAFSITISIEARKLFYAPPSKKL